MDTTSRFEDAFVIFVLFFFTGSPLGIFEAYGIQNLIFLLIYITSLLLILLNRAKLTILLKKRRLFIFFLPVFLLCFVLSSTLWSELPSITLQRSLFLMGSSLFGIYFGCIYPQDKQLSLLSKSFAIAIILSFVYAIVPPHYGIMSEIHIGAWRGIFLSKNGLAYAMALSLTVYINLTVTSVKEKLFKVTFMGLSILLIILSTGKGGLIIFMLLFITYWASKIVQRLRWDILIPMVLGFSILAGIIGLSLFYGVEIFLNSIGKEMTLSARSQIWYGLWNAFQKKPLLGYGYGSFWEGGQTSIAASTVMSYFDWTSNPHSGLLDLLINIGIVGTILYLIVFICLYFRAFYLVRFSKSLEFLWPFCFLTYFFLSNLAETNAMGFKDIPWVLYMSVIGTLSIKSKEITAPRNKLLVSELSV
jgi:exopolysaccharide production protein ExoQ